MKSKRKLSDAILAEQKQEEEEHKDDVIYDKEISYGRYKKTGKKNLFIKLRRTTEFDEIKELLKKNEKEMRKIRDVERTRKRADVNKQINLNILLLHICNVVYFPLILSIIVSIAILNLSLNAEFLLLAVIISLLVITGITNYVSFTLEKLEKEIKP